MAVAKFLPGTLVRDNHARVGSVSGEPTVVELDGNPVEVYPVDFWGSVVKRPDNWLTPLAPDSPEALLVERPDALAPWADEAPLRLVALALSVDGGTGKVADIRAKLEGRVIEESRWRNWWNQRTRVLGNLPEHFGVAKVKGGNEYRLLSNFWAVPLNWTAPAKVKAGPTKPWKEWLLSGSPENVPGRYPTKPVIESLAKWVDADTTIEQVLVRLGVTAEALRSKDNMPSGDAEGWLKAIATAAIRRREVGGQDPRGYDASGSGSILIRLARIAGDRTPYDLLLLAGALDGATDSWRRGYLAGMWESFEGEDAREMYLRSSAVLGQQARGGLAREIFLAAFGPDFSERRHSELDRLLDALPEGERDQLLREVVASAPADQINNVLGYVANSRHAQGAGHLPLRIAAALLLTDGQGTFAAQASRESADAMDAPGAYAPAVEGLFKDTAAKLRNAIAGKDDEIAGLQEAHEAELVSERREQERLRQQVRQRNADLAARREESRLEIRRDMLLAIGEVLQLARLGDSCNETLGNVEAGLRLALRAGGAEVVDSAPEGYDLRLHRSEEELAISTPVRVVAPGVIVRGETDGDLVLLKAKVSREAG